MIQSGTFLNVIDNSGAKKAMCIKILNAGYKQRYATIGSTILVAIKATKSSSTIKVKKGEMHRALVIKTKIIKNSFSNNLRKFFDNGIVLLNAKNKLLGTRIFSKIPRELKNSKFLKLITLSSGLSI